MNMTVIFRLDEDDAAQDRLTRVLDSAAAHLSRIPRIEDAAPGMNIIFAAHLPRGGVNLELMRLLGYMRTHKHCLDGCTGGIIIDGDEELYTRSAGRELILAANMAGCAFPGHPLVEGTASLANFAVRARTAGSGLFDAYCASAADLIARVSCRSAAVIDPERHEGRAKLLVLHASNRSTSNTLALWGELRRRIDDAFDITEICLRNGTLEDCGACPYTACLHFGESGGCFYGGVMVRDVYPAIRAADAVLLLCPNYNDALSANITAAINRLTALYRTYSFAEKAVFAIAVSGYSGGDIIAEQIVSALCINKGFCLPPRFCMFETANDAGSAMRLEGIGERLDDFAKIMRNAKLKTSSAR